MRIPREVAHRLGYYVYLYVDPRDGEPFYVGKGKGKRVLSHLSEAGEPRKCARIADLRADAGDAFLRGGLLVSGVVRSRTQQKESR